jgi:RIO kinase 1
MADLEEHIGGGYVEEILGEVKSGKEATVYCCSGGYRLEGRLVAAKIYRARTVRQFANAAVYNAGRLRQRTKRETRAMETRTRFGQGAAFSKWVADEYETLRLLHDGGVRVPEPFVRSERIILMEYIGTEDAPAPLLQAADVDASEARAVFASLMDDVEAMLRLDRVHGDLSPFNVLFDGGKAWIIDLPQAVDARFNPNAQSLLDRDVERLCQWAERRGVPVDAWKLSRDLWRRYIRSDL